MKFANNSLQLLTLFTRDATVYLFARPEGSVASIPHSIMNIISKPQFTVLHRPQAIDRNASERRRLLLIGANHAKYSVGAMGTTHHIAQIAREMSLRGYEVHIALGWNTKSLNSGYLAADPAPKFEGSPNTYVVKYDLCEHSASRIGQASKALTRYIQETGAFDIIHAIGMWGGQVALKAKRGPQTQLLFSPQELDPLVYESGSFARLRYTQKLRKICKSVDLVMCASQHHLELLAQHKVPQHLLRLVPSGISPPRPIDTFSARRSLKLSESEIWFGYCGRLDEHCGVTELLTAFSQLAEKHPRTGLLVAGCGPAEAHLKEHACQLGLNGRVNWEPSKRSELAMAAIDVYVQPGGTEAFPYNVMRATSRGLPVIMADRGGAAELNEKHAAICVPPLSVDALHKALALLAEPNGERQSRVPEALKVAKYFSLERAMAGIEGTYCELISA